jgi:hypothetical protein
LSNTTLGRTYRLYKGTEAVDVLTGTGNPATFTGTFASAGTYTAQVEAEGGNCAAVMTGSHTVSENPLPTSLSLSANPATICNGQSATLTAVANGAASYSIDNSAWQTTTTFNVSPTSNQSYTLFVRTAAGCSASAAHAAAVAVNPIPSAPTMAGSSSYCTSGTITATYGSGGNGIKWDNNSTTSLRTVTATGNYTAVTTSAAGCTSSSATKSVTIVQKGTSGNAATACGCVDGLTPCGGTCQATCGLFSDCPGFSEVTSTQYEGAGPIHYSQAAATCSNKGNGWRLPNAEEFACMCKAGSALPGGKLIGVIHHYDYGGGSPRCLCFSVPTCECGAASFNFEGAGVYAYVKCVKN